MEVAAVRTGGRGWSWTAALGALVAALASASQAQIAPLRPGKGGGAAQLRERVRVAVHVSKPQARPGDQLALAVVLDFAPGWHAWTNPPIVPDFLGRDFQAVPTQIELAQVEGVERVGPVQWPAPHEVPFLGGSLQALSGRAVAYVPLMLSPEAAPGRLTIPVTVRYQACDDKQCLAPTTETLQATVEIVPVGEPIDQQGDARLFADFDLTVFQKMLSGELREDRPPVRFNAFGLAFEIDPDGAGFALLLLVAALGGALLNLTPCVLPVLPIKIMGLARSAGDPRRTLLLGTVMAAGVVAFWMAIGAAIAFVSGFDAINALFQRPWFSVMVGLVIGAMGLGMLGLFTVRLPRAVYMVNPNHETVVGSFLFGVMTAVLATPCTAPFMGSAAAWATTQAPATTLATFAAIGLGMALPYFLLSASPRLAERIPKAGPAGELVKQTMGLLMFAVAAFFAGVGLSALFAQPPAPPSRAYWWVVAAFVVVAFLWLAVRTWRLTSRPGLRLGCAALAAAALVGAPWAAATLTDRGPIDWVYYTPQKLDEALQRGDVVVMDFTAEWCLNCKALETAVLHNERVAQLLASDGVTPIKVDITAGDPASTAMLRSLGSTTIPLLAVFGPGLDEPVTYDSYTVEMVLEAVARARGGAAAAAAAGR